MCFFDFWRVFTAALRAYPRKVYRPDSSIASSTQSFACSTRSILSFLSLAQHNILGLQYFPSAYHYSHTSSNRTLLAWCIIGSDLCVSVLMYTNYGHCHSLFVATEKFGFAYPHCSFAIDLPVDIVTVFFCTTRYTLSEEHFLLWNFFVYPEQRVSPLKDTSS